MDLHDIHPLSLHELRTAAEEAGVDPAIKKRHEVAYALARLSSGEGEPIAAGFLELLNDGYGFLRQEEAGYAQSPDDVFVSAALVRAGNLRAGDHIVGPVSPPKDGDKNLRLSGVDTVNGSPVNGRARKRRRFDALTPAYPDSQFRLEHSPKNLSTRFVDLFAPIGRGQRCLVVSPPKAGKTVLLKDIAHAITANHPAAELIVLLIDERPEEVTDMRESVRGHVVASTFDEPATRHVSVAEMTIERAKRLVEDGKDVIILLDSLTRLARAYNTTVPSTGKVLTGGVDSNALQRPKRFFGAARNLKEGGSLTIIATALVDTGSRMDDVIFEEFKGTGNSEIALDRKLMEKRVFPCLDINRSGTRKEELLQDEETLGRMWLLRGLLHPLSALDAMEFVKDRLAKTKTNAEFIATMNR